MSSSSAEVLMDASSSKLSPLAGSIADKQEKFNEKSMSALPLFHCICIRPSRLKAGAAQRYVDDLLAPTAAGKEPKSVELMKSVTWFAVCVLVIIEIFVSVKVGGMPFDFGKVSLPSFEIPNFFNSKL